jgi:flagellar biosynthesis protein FlhG
VNNHTAISPADGPKIWAVGGGKGGVGKSLVSILLAIELAQRNRKTILIDTDLGGANLHTLMGIKTPSRTLNDFVTRKYSAMEEICIPTTLNNLQVICGASEILSFANPQYAQKNKIVQSLSRLPADHVVLDLGAGTSYNVLDFFLIADHPIVVVTPQPISIQNAYGFVRNAVYRKLSRMTSQHTYLQKLISKAMDPKNENQLHTIPDLLAAISEHYSEANVQQIKNAIASIAPWIVTNIARDGRDRNAGRIIQLVAEKYLTVSVTELGTIHYDPMIENLVSQMTSIAQLPLTSSARSDAAMLVQRLVPDA